MLIISLHSIIRKLKKLFKALIKIFPYQFKINKNKNLILKNNINKKWFYDTIC